MKQHVVLCRALILILSLTSCDAVDSNTGEQAPPSEQPPLDACSLFYPWFSGQTDGGGVSFSFIDTNTGWKSYYGGWASLLRSYNKSRELYKTTTGGARWTERQIPEAIRDVASVSYVDSLVGYAIGVSGRVCECPLAWLGVKCELDCFYTLYRTNEFGGSWPRLWWMRVETRGSREPDPAEIPRIFFIDKDTGWLAQGPSVRRTSDGGHTWSDPVDTGVNVRSIFFVTADSGWVVLGRGPTLYYDTPLPTIIARSTDGGRSWVNQEIRIDESLSSVFFVDTKTGWAVGDCGVILKSTDGGNVWMRQYSGVSNGLNYVFFEDANRGRVWGNHKKDAMWDLVLTTDDGGKTWQHVAGQAYNCPCPPASG